jgi:hypothetical protein
MNLSVRHTIDSKTRANRDIARPSNGGIAEPLHLPTLQSRTGLIGSFRPVKLKREESINENPSLGDKQFPDPLAENSAHNQPSLVPTPATKKGLCRDDVHEVTVDTIPITTFEKNLIPREPSTKCLGGSFWGESTNTSRRNNSESSLPLSAKPVAVRNRSVPVATSTALQRQWEVGNTFNLHQTISSLRCLDDDPWSGR